MKVNLVYTMQDLLIFQNTAILNTSETVSNHRELIPSKNFTCNFRYENSVSYVDSIPYVKHKLHIWNYNFYSWIVYFIRGIHVPAHELFPWEILKQLISHVWHWVNYVKTFTLNMWSEKFICDNSICCFLMEWNKIFVTVIFCQCSREKFLKQEQWILIPQKDI